MTASSFQFAARRLRVLLRGVFHFKICHLISVIVVARARARVQIRTAGTTQALARVTASQSHRQNGQNDLPREIRHVERSVHEDVAFAERVVRTIDLRIETLPTSTSTGRLTGSRQASQSPSASAVTVPSTSKIRSAHLTVSSTCAGLGKVSPRTAPSGRRLRA